MKLRESLLFIVYIPYIFTLFDEFSPIVCPIAYKCVGVFAIIIKGPFCEYVLLSLALQFTNSFAKEKG